MNKPAPEYVIPAGATTVDRLTDTIGRVTEAQVPRKMPRQKPGKSAQDVGTPPEFIAAVTLRFGLIGWDLAATRENSVVPMGCFFGPGHYEGEDALKEDWDLDGLLWLNPPYADIGPWAKKCVEESAKGAEISMLIPAAVGTNYFREYIANKCRVYFLSPRLTFVGHTQSYPKDLILCHYGPSVTPGFECWRWKP